MVISVTEALDGDTAILVTVERATGSWIDGRWVVGVPVLFKTMASPQQPTPKQLQNLPENERTSDVMVFYCAKPVFSTKDREGLPADHIIFKGVKRKVIATADWDTFGHTIAFAARVRVDAT